MKTLIALLFSLSAHAQSADQLNTVMTCIRLHPIPDLGMSVTVYTGGFAGLTQVSVRNFFLGHSTASTYIVQQVPQHQGRMGEGVTYTGDGLVLSTNFTTAPEPDGGHYGTLKIANESENFQAELSCKLN